MHLRVSSVPYTYLDTPRDLAAADGTAALLAWGGVVGHRYRMPAGTEAIQQGGSASHALLIATGHALLYRREQSGLDVAVAMCGAGAVLGLSSVMNQSPHAVSAVIRSDAEGIAIAADQIVTALATPDLGPILVRRLASENLGLIRRYAARTALSVRDRVMVLLDEEARRFGRRPCAVSLGPGDLASLVGADLSHVYRVLRGLKTAGMVDFARGRITVLAAPHSTPTV